MYWIVAAFDSTGLTPDIYVYDLSDDSLVVDGESMSEVAKGGYKYEFTLWDGSKDYFWVADGGGGRTAYGSISGSDVIEGTHTRDDVMRLMLSALMAIASGGGSTEITFRNIADDKDRIVMTVDTNGNRSAVTLDGTI